MPVSGLALAERIARVLAAEAHSSNAEGSDPSAGDKIDLYRIQNISDQAKQMGEFLAKAGIELAAALDRLEGFAELKPHRLEIHRLENEGDRLTRAAIGELFSTVTDASELVKWKDIYDLLEATMDACEHTANVMETIAIKNA